jgi:hypothetical protein
VIVELRQYTLHPGQRDVLIELFDREFVETQEVLGMHVLGQFRDLDRPDRFVWLRGFPDMAARAVGLNAFYSGPVWKKHAHAANATMVDSDNVLLLRPVSPTSGLDVPAERGTGGTGVVYAAICSFDAPIAADVVDQFADYLAAQDALLGVYVTEPSPNNYPALPVRAEHVLVWFAGASLTPLPEHLERQLSRPPEVLRLAPTSRSRLHA